MTRVPGWAGAAAAVVMVLLLTALFDRLEFARFQSEQRAAVLDRLSSQRATLEASLNARLYLVRGLAAFVQTGDPVTEDRFATFARNLIGSRADLRGLMLAPDSVIRHVYPYAPNAAAIGTDLLSIPRFEAVIRRTIASNSLTVAGPVELVQGGAGLIGRIPVFFDRDGTRELWGLAIIVLDLPPLLSEAGLLEDGQLTHAIRGRDGRGAEGEVFFGDSILFSRDPVLMDVSIPNGTWQIAAIPQGGWAQSSPNRTSLLLAGAALALLAGLAVHRLLSQAERLRRAVAASREGEAQLRDAVDCLAASNAELERFAYVASHDLQEPLRTITSFAQLLERRSRDRLGPEDLEFLEFIVSGAKRMHALVNDLLAYSRVTNKGAPFIRVPVAALVEKVLLNLHESLTAAGAQVTVGPLPDVLGDEMQLLQLFQNLIGNAVKFHRPGVPPTIAITGTPGPEGVLFQVVDNGIGIDTEYRESIFTIFTRLHPGDTYPGTGIGLAICKRIVDRHGGHIWIEDAPKGGAAFHFLLPPAPAPAPEAEAAEAGAP